MRIVIALGALALMRSSLLQGGEADAPKTILGIYGSFETDGRLEGWEAQDARASCKVVKEMARDGEHALHITAKDVKYVRPAVRIDPYLEWKAEDGLSFSFSIMMRYRYSGYNIYATIIADDPETKTTYTWIFSPMSYSGSDGIELIKAGAGGWAYSLGKRRMGGFEFYKPGATTFIQWLPGLQVTANSARLNQWVDFKVDLRQTLTTFFGHPQVPARLKIRELTFANYIHTKTDWMLDAVKLTITPKQEQEEEDTLKELGAEE